MAESSIKYKGWLAEFDITDFALIWHVIHAVLDPEIIRTQPGGLQARLQQLIEKDHLLDDWYHGPELDPVIAGDEEEFSQILGGALYRAQHFPDLWESLKCAEWAVQKASQTRYGGPAQREIFVFHLMRFALPALAPETSHAVMYSLGWNRIHVTTDEEKARVARAQGAISRQWEILKARVRPPT